MTRIAIAVIVGILIGNWWGAALQQWLLLVVDFLLIAACLIAERSQNIRISIVFVYLLSFFFGVTIVTRQNKLLGNPFPGNKDLCYEAVVVDEPRVRGRTLQCDLAVTSVEGRQLHKPVKIKAAVVCDTVTKSYKSLHPGSGIMAVSGIKPLVNYYLGSNFDYVRWLRCHGFVAQTLVYYDKWQFARVPLSQLSFAERIRLKALLFRSRLMGWLFDGSDDNEQQAVISAMALGDKHGLSRATRDVYSVTGASHVLALSGLHMGIIFSILMLFMRRWRFLWLTQLLLLSAIWMFAFIVGLGTSVVRSAVMLSVYSLCVVARRDKASLSTLAFAALCLIVSNPLCLWDLGFQMSFFSVLSIILLYSKLYGLFEVDNPLLRKIWGMAVVSLVAQMGTAPLTAFYFGRFSCYFIFTNFLVVPAAMVIIYGVALAVCVYPFPMLTHCIMFIEYKIVGWLDSVLGWISSLPGASVENITINKWQLTLLYFMLAIFCYLVTFVSRRRKKRKPDDLF